MSSEKLADHRLVLRGTGVIPLVQGGMGVDISTADLALEVARLGGVGHISDAMAPFVSDRKYGTRFQNEKLKLYRASVDSMDKTGVKWGTEAVYQASFNHASQTMQRKQGSGLVFINVMEKLGMGAPAETLRARLQGALDGGIDGVTLSAGLHTGTPALFEDHPRFNDVLLGIIVSSARALKIFLRSSKRAGRLPDYVIVEGPLAGGHLGFGEDWRSYDLREIVKEVIQFLAEEKLSIPVIPAGGVFTGADALDYLGMGAAAVQVATRFTISRECGLPEAVKQEYARAREEDIVVNTLSPTGYLMRMLNSSPCMSSNVRPNCEALGYILDKDQRCSYHAAYEAAGWDSDGTHRPVTDKMCICYHFMKFTCYTCGQNAYRLKDTTHKLADGSYYLPAAEEIFNDYVGYANPATVATPNAAPNGVGSAVDAVTAVGPEYRIASVA